MIRRLLPSALCIFLSPLLVAQQAAQQGAASTTQPEPPAQIPLQIALSLDAPIRIVSPGDVPFSKIKPGTTIRFVIDRDVIVNGVKVFAASTPIEGVVDKVIHASRFKNRFFYCNNKLSSIINKCFLPTNFLHCKKFFFAL